jgi:hypothetical protein
METKIQERDLLDVERRFWDAMKTKDGSTAGKMTDDGCIIVGAQGVSVIDGKTMGKLTTEGPWQLKQYSFDEKNTKVRFIGDDLAIVAYKVSERVVIDGETLPIEANDSSVWVRRDGEWRCALHTESLAGDPYGRDKREVAG